MPAPISTPIRVNLPTSIERMWSIRGLMALPLRYRSTGVIPFARAYPASCQHLRLESGASGYNRLQPRQYAVAREDAMKNGFRVYDTDTHIDPGADVLERYVDPGFRKRLDDLAPYRVAIKSRTVDGGIRHTYRFDQRVYERTPGEGGTRPGTGDGRVWRGERRPSPGVVDDRSDNRVLDMDAEGADGHFLVPSVWTSIV